MFRGSAFEKSLEKATSHLLLEPDLESQLKIVDAINQNDIQSKAAVQAIRKKIASDNPHVASYALSVLDVCVKNCGAPFHREIANRDFMEFLRSQSKRPDPVNGKILELIQTWAKAFRSDPNYKAVEDTFRLLKMEGFHFPELQEADAMFTAERAPELKDGERCSRCRVRFNLVQRKYNCRYCGDIFCQKCTPYTSIIPKFGIEREVKVCDACFDKIRNPDKKETEELPASSSPRQAQVLTEDDQQTKPKKKVVRPQTEEDEELQLAIALSRSEAESKEKEYWRKESERERLQKLYGMPGGGSPSPGQFSAPTDPAQQPMVLSGMDATDMDPELARYLNRNYWQKKSESAGLAPSAPQAAASSQPTGKSVDSDHQAQNGEQAQADKAQFMAALQSSLEIFVNRMRSNSQRGRPIANDSSVQSLFNVISSMHPQLVRYLQEIEDKRAYFEGLQDKLAQLRDAREALDSLREEHREKRRREMEEMERQRQIQMMQKLEVMRQKKQEYLEMQRQQALQRLQEQEREMAMRLEQQKQLTQMRQMQAYGYPQMYGQQQMTNPSGMMMGPPGMMPPQNLPASMGPQGPQGAPPTMMGGYMPGPLSTDGGPPTAHGGQPGPQQGQYSGTEVPSGAGGAPGPLQGQQVSAMFMPPAAGQSPYPQGPPMAGGSTAAPPHPQVGGAMAGGYPPSEHQIPPQAQMQIEGGQPPVVCGPASGYTGPPASMAYTSMPPTMDYDYFNMQGLASTLPQQQQQQPGQAGGPSPPASQAMQQPAPGQPYVGGTPSPHPPTQYPPPSNRSNNQMAASHPLPPQHYPMSTPPAQPLPTQPSAQDAQLISFD